MFQRIRDLVADVCRYEETAPIDNACMRCILLWSAVVLVMLNLSYNSFDRPIVFVSTLFICLTLFGYRCCSPMCGTRSAPSLRGPFSSF